MAKRQLTMGSYHGKLQVLPPLWKFSKMNGKLIDSWYVGDERDMIPTLALLTHHEVSHLGGIYNLNLGKVKLRQIRLAMSLVGTY